MARSILASAAVREHTLANGLRVLTKEIHTAPIVSMMTWYRVGSRFERAGETGVSHFLEHMMFKGTDRYGKGEIDLITQRNGGNNNAFTAYDYTAYHFAFASDRWTEALAIEASRMRRCAFDPVEFEAEKQVVLEEWRMCQDSPWHPLIDLVNSTAFTLHPYRTPVLGWRHDVQGLTREQMVAYYDRYYGPNNATLVLVGDFDTDEALREIERHFGGLEPVALGEPPVPAEPVQEGERRVILQRPSAMPRLAMAFRQPAYGDPDLPAIEVLATLLAQGRSSRLYRRLVEELQIAGDVGTELFLATDPFLFTVFAELKPGGSVPKVEKAILAEIKRLQTERVDESELLKAKNILIAARAFDDESTMQQASRYGEAAVLGRWQDADRVLDEWLAVSESDIQRVAVRYLTEKNRTIGVLKPEKPTTGMADHDLPPIETVQAPPAKRRNVPAPLPERPRLFLPQVHRTQLANGLILLVQANPASPTVAIKAHLGVGSRFEAAAQAGLASLVANALVKGAGERDAEAMAETVESVGGYLDATAGLTGTSIGARFLSRHTHLGLSLVADLLRRPQFAEAEVLKERDLQLDDLLADQDEPKTIARRAFHRLVYGQHPAHRSPDGHIDTVPNLTRADVQAFYERWYRPERTILVVVGDVDPAAVAAQVADAFGAWSAGTDTLPGIALPPEPTEPRQQIIVQDRAQANVYLGHLGIRRDHPDFVALEVLETILGGGSGLSSRIPASVRDEKGLAYTTYCDLTGSAGLEPGTFHAYLATDPQHVAAGVQAVIEHFELIRAESVTAEELDDAKAYLTGSCAFQLETNMQKADYLLRTEVFGLGFDYLQTYTDQVLALTREDILQAARDHLRPEALSLVAVGALDPALTLV